MASIRAILLRTSVATLQRIATPQQVAQLEGHDPSLFAAIRNAGALDWLELDHDLALSELVAVQLAPELDRQRARQCLRTALDAPLLRPFVHGVETLFTLDPGGMLRQVPRGWPVLYRDAGSMAYEIGGLGRRMIVYRDVPSAILDHPSYLDAIAGAFESFFDLCNVLEGQAEVERVAPDRVHFHLDWW